MPIGPARPVIASLRAITEDRPYEDCVQSFQARSAATTGYPTVLGASDGPPFPLQAWAAFVERTCCGFLGEAHSFEVPEIARQRRME